MNNSEKFISLMLDAGKGLGQDERNQLYNDRHFKKTAVELAHAMREAELVKEWMEGIEKCLNAEIDVIRLNLLPVAMENEGLESPLNVAGVGRVSLTGDVYASVLNKEYLFELLELVGSGDLIQETVNATTLKAWVKTKIKAGEYLFGSLTELDKYEQMLIDSGRPVPEVVAKVKAWVGDKLAHGEEVSDVLKVTPYTRASITKPKA